MKRILSLALIGLALAACRPEPICTVSTIFTATGPVDRMEIGMEIIDEYVSVISVAQGAVISARTETEYTDRCDMAYPLAEERAIAAAPEAKARALERTYEWKGQKIKLVEIAPEVYFGDTPIYGVFQIFGSVLGAPVVNDLFQMVDVE